LTAVCGSPAASRAAQCSTYSSKVCSAGTKKRLFAYRNSDHVRVTGSRRVTSTRTSGSVAASPAASRDPPWKSRGDDSIR